jgi:phosphoglycolate phosphatase-like HAD superfamily hydrolase
MATHRIRRPDISPTWAAIALFLGLLLGPIDISWAEKTPAVSADAPLLSVTDGERVGFDLDNTLFDTRYRTQAALRDFGKTVRSADVQRALVRAARISNIRIDGESTARHLGLSEANVTAFAAHWNRFFWDRKNYHFDRKIPKMVKLVKDASAAGAEPYYITGRTRRGTTATLTQLRDAGLPNADREHVHLKPNVQHKTLGFKLDTAQKLRLGTYATDSAREANAMHAIGVRGALVHFPLQLGKEERPVRGVLRINPGRR